MRSARTTPTITPSQATEVFVRGFSFTRSFTHPYVVDRVGPLWVARDGPRKNTKEYRREEWIACAVEPAEVDRVARKRTRGRFAICAVHPVGEDEVAMRAAYKLLGYRLGGTEPLMVHGLKRIPRFASPAIVERVTARDVADRLAKVAKSRQVLPEHLADRHAPLRQYVATVEGEIVGWVRSIRTGLGTWCSNMHVLPAYRRRGIARAMLCRMLRDDRAGGAKVAVLTASHAGAKLYPLVGYEQLATVYLFTPRKR